MDAKQVFNTYVERSQQKHLLPMPKFAGHMTRMLRILPTLLKTSKTDENLIYQLVRTIKEPWIGMYATVGAIVFVCVKEKSVEKTPYLLEDYKHRRVQQEMMEIARYHGHLLNYAKSP